MIREIKFHLSFPVQELELIKRREWEAGSKQTERYGSLHNKQQTCEIPCQRLLGTAA